MNHREEITAELKQIDPSMAQWPFHMPYRLPAGYFEAATEKFLESASLGLHIEKNKGYQVPGVYFDQLAGNIMAAIRRQEVEQELDDLAPLLNNVSREMPYSHISLPEFNMEAIMGQAAANQIPVIKMPVRKTRKWLQYAAAAVLAGVILTTAFLYNGDNNNAVDEATLASYAQMDVSKEMTMLSEEELNTYLTTTEKLVVTSGERDQYGEDELPDVNEHIQLMSDDELKQYLDESAETSAEAKVDTNS